MKIKSAKFQLLFILAANLLAAILAANFLKVEKISCQLKDGSSCPNSTLNQLEQLKNKNLLLTNFSQQINDSTIKIILPQELRITLNQVIGKNLIKINNQNYLIENGGELNQTDQSGGINFLIADPNLITPELGKKLSELLTALSTTKLEINSINYHNDFFILKLKPYRQAILYDNFQERIKYLELIETQVNFSNYKEEIKEIDLRYKLPVLRAEPEF